MKKITSVALAGLFSTAILLASSNAGAMGISWHNSSHSYQTASDPISWVIDFLTGNNNDYRGRQARDVPAPIPGLLALAAAAGGGIMLRRKSRKNKSDD